MRPSTGPGAASSGPTSSPSSIDATSCPKWSATSSTSAWLTRLDLPEPDTPVTAVSAPTGNLAVTSRRLLHATSASTSHPAASRRPGFSTFAAGNR